MEVLKLKNTVSFEDNNSPWMGLQVDCTQMKNNLVNVR